MNFHLFFAHTSNVTFSVQVALWPLGRMFASGLCSHSALCTPHLNSCLLEAKTMYMCLFLPTDLTLNIMSWIIYIFYFLRMQTEEWIVGIHWSKLTPILLGWLSGKEQILHGRKDKKKRALHHTFHFCVPKFKVPTILLPLILLSHFFFSFFFFFFFLRATFFAFGGSHAWGPFGAIATSLCQSHSNAGSEPCLTAIPDP